MGAYLNPGSDSFAEAVGSSVYVDKTTMVRHLNSVARTKRKYVSVSRPRRFGKTMAADMVCAYYGRGTDARQLFEGLGLARTEPVRRATGESLSWDAYLGAFDVVHVTVTEFLRQGKPITACIDRMQKLVARELVREYPKADYFDTDDLALTMSDAYEHTGRQFVVVIDEWDAPMRERAHDEEGQRAYLDFLRDWLKDKRYVALAYMTGILPIKKYGVHSALNMFDEYSMVRPLQLAEYTGFTEAEVRALCETFHMDFETVKAWYDGYEVTGVVPVERRGFGDVPPRYSLYAPLSVASAVESGEVDSYWGGTETYEALAEYVRMDFDGLKQKVATLMDGGRVRARLTTYQNDMATFRSADDVIALLVHLGYLGWDSRAGEAFVPNHEVMGVFRDSTSGPAWDLAFREYETSKALVRATWEADSEAVAAALEAAHDRADNKTYNSEAALSYAVRLAYYAALRWYTEAVELDSGRGYADIAYLPSPRHPGIPALVVELKWNRDARTALDQIRNRNYPARLAHYAGNLLLVGVSYDASARAGTAEHKRHSCAIERA